MTISKKKSQEQSKSFAKSIKRSPMYEAMDENNKKSTYRDVKRRCRCNHKAHKFTDQATGRQLSYSEIKVWLANIST